MLQTFYLDPEPIRRKHDNPHSSPIILSARMRAFRKVLIFVLAASILFTGFFSIYYIRRMIPDRLRLICGEESQISMQLPIQATLTAGSKEVTISNSSNIPSDQVHVLLSDGFSLYSDSLGEYSIGIDLLGFLHITDVNIQVIDGEQIYPCGEPIGVYLKTDGVLIVGTGTVTDRTGKDQEPAYGIVRSGDYILEVDGIEVNTKEQVAAQIEAAGGKADTGSGGAEVELSLRRKDETIKVRVPVVEAEDGTYKAGIWVRDDTQGIGTLTYVTADGSFGALGHGISDSDTEELIEADGGSLYHALIRSVIRGTMGTPGSLSGVIRYSDSDWLGEIECNTDHGIFGQLSEEGMDEMDLSRGVPVALSQEICEGDATILCAVEGEVGEYKVRITRIDLGRKDNKSMVIEVTDSRLLAITGGIVQGMSGSPILQNGKIVGAVTHVLVNDPTKGYGIFIETMLERP